MKINEFYNYIYSDMAIIRDKEIVLKDQSVKGNKKNKKSERTVQQISDEKVKELNTKARSREQKII